MKKSTARKILSVVSVILALCVVMAGCAAPAQSGTADGAAGGGTAGTIQFVVSIVLLVAVFYFFMIRPEKKRKKEAEELRSSISTGDSIVTIGGMTGKVVSVSNDSLVFETGEDRVRIEIKKWAVSRKEK